MKIIEESHRKKHYQNKNYSCVSISLYHMGLIGAGNGPTYFLKKVKQNSKVYTDALFKRNRSANVSSLYMTENAYMTYGVCLAMTTKVIKVIHTMPYIEWNIRCCVLEIFDGFGYHISVLCALEL